MPGFENLDQAIQPGEALAQILPDQVEFSDQWTDEVALGILLADIDSGIGFEQAKNFATRM